jgi:hypothetical protein
MKNLKLLLSAVLLSASVGISSCKEHHEEGHQDVGAAVQNGESFSNEQNNANGNQQEDHPGQNIGNNSDSTSVEGKPGNRSNY